MNSLWVRLTAAFVAVTLLSVSLIALLVDYSAATQFRHYLGRRQSLAQGKLVEALAEFYQRRGSWEGVEVVLNAAQPMRGGILPNGGGRRLVELTDAAGATVYRQPASEYRTRSSSHPQPVRVANRIIGYVIWDDSANSVMAAALEPIEQAFLNQLRRSLLLSALAAGLGGVILGLTISRTISAPLSRLAQAARDFAARPPTAPRRVNASHPRLEGCRQ